jgi:hypothetical protein
MVKHFIYIKKFQKDQIWQILPLKRPNGNPDQSNNQLTYDSNNKDNSVKDMKLNFLLQQAVLGEAFTLPFRPRTV